MKEKNEVRRTWVRLALKAVIIIVILWLCFGVFVGMRRVSDVSMDGRINDGDFVLFNRIDKEYGIGDVVFYTHDGQEQLSEIIGTEGDLITISNDGYLLVNGMLFSKSPVYDYTLGETNPFGDGYRVPKNGYFMLNSNYGDINDSRSFGAVNKNAIKGYVIALLLRTRSF